MLLAFGIIALLLCLTGGSNFSYYAQLNTVATYFDWVSTLASLQARKQHDLRTLYQACQILADQPVTQRNHYLNNSSPIQWTIHPQPTSL